MQRLILSIDGIDGSGKSIFGRKLIDALTESGVDATLFSIDDYRCPVNWEQDKSEADIYYEQYFDLTALDAVLAQIVSGASSVRVPIWDSVKEQVDGTRRVGLDAVEIVIVEGVFPMRLVQLHQAMSVYLTLPLEIARNRIIERDVAKGRTVSEVERRIDERYFPAQQRYQRECAPENSSTMLIDVADWTSPDIISLDEEAMDPNVLETLLETLNL